MVDTISRTDQVLVLLNRFAHSGETSGIPGRLVSDYPQQQTKPFSPAFDKENEGTSTAEAARTHTQTEQNTQRLSFQTRGPEARRASFSGSQASSAALEVVLGQQNASADPSRRLR
jgi:hypothetical protein